MLPRASSTPPSRTPRPWTSVALGALPVGYVAIAAFRSGEFGTRFVFSLVVAIAVLVAGTLRGGWASTNARRRSHAWITTSIAVSIAAAGLSGRPAWAALVRELFAFISAIFAISALFRIEPDAGLATEATAAVHARRPTVRDVERIVQGLVVLVASQAIVVDVLLIAGSGGALDKVAPIAGALGGAATLFLMGGAALVVTGMRRHELGAPPRALACAASAGIGLLVATTLAFATTLSAEAASGVGVTMSSYGMLVVASKGQAIRIAERGRRILTLSLFGGPLVALAATAAGHGAGATVLVLSLAALVVGAFVTPLEEPLLPARGALLRALQSARTRSFDRDGRAAIAQALLDLRSASGHISTADDPGASAELWMLHPTRVLTVDAAGYLHERPAELPESLVATAEAEPYRTLRADVLRALDVRRPDLRGLLSWFEARGAMAATIIAGDDEPDGVLVLPQGSRSEPLSIEEALGLMRVADAFVSICHAESARLRHLAREQALRERIDALDDRLAQVSRTLGMEAGRAELASARLARPATVGGYSAPSRLAFDAIARRLEHDAPVVVLAPPGIDPVPFLARGHLSSPRKDKPLVLVDGTSSREHDLARWTDPTVSPLALADGGRLVLVDGAALPLDVQTFLARALVERRTPWERPSALDIQLALTSLADPSSLIAEGRLARELASQFEGEPPVTLPGLSERAEDLFAIIADRLAREGLRVHGRPIGIDAGAFARFVEHPFEGEEAELSLIVTRLVARVSGDVVRAADVDALDLRTKPCPEEERLDRSVGSGDISSSSTTSEEVPRRSRDA